MIARQTNVHVESNITGEAARMKIAKGGMSWIMGILTDMYSNRILACIREYSTNGRDAHIQAGFPGPIEVTLPNDLAPFLRIKDYGVGLSEAEIHDVYSQYGESTKRQSDDYNGMFGIGCKSALSYAAQFTLVSVKDGRRIQVVVSRDGQGGTMTPVSNTPTDDASGTEVIIPVERHDIQRFKDEAATLFSVWDEGTVLVNGEQPKRFEGLKLTDSLYVIEGEQSYVVMGDVRYPAKIRHPFKWNHSVMAFVDLGTVEIHPSRESLIEGPWTNPALEAIAEEVEQGVEGAIQRAIDDEAAAPHDAVKIASRWSQMLDRVPITTFTYNGKPLPGAIKGDFRVVPHHSHVLKRSSMYSQVSAFDWPRSIWLYGYDPSKEFSAPKKRKLTQWYRNDSGMFDENAPSYPHQYVLCEHKPSAEDTLWIGADRIFKWDDVAAQKLPRDTVNHRTGQPMKKITGSFAMWIDGESHDEVAAADINTNNPVYFLVGCRLWEAGGYARILADHHRYGYTLVVMGSNREAKFKRDFPMAKSPHDACTAAYLRWVKTVDPMDLKALGIQQSYYAAAKYAALVPVKDRLDDPVLVALIEAAGKDLTALEQKRRMFFNVIGQMPEVERVTSDHYLAEQYPLYDDGHMRNADTVEQVIRYINNEYAIRANSND